MDQVKKGVYYVKDALITNKKGYDNVDAGEEEKLKPGEEKVMWFRTERPAATRLESLFGSESYFGTTTPAERNMTDVVESAFPKKPAAQAQQPEQPQEENGDLLLEMVEDFGAEPRQPLDDPEPRGLMNNTRLDFENRVTPLAQRYPKTAHTINSVVMGGAGIALGMLALSKLVELGTLASSDATFIQNFLTNVTTASPATISSVLATAHERATELTTLGQSVLTPMISIVNATVNLYTQG